MSDPIAPFLASLAGKRIAGGCDSCDAEQRLEESAPNVWTLVVGHEDDCPFLRAKKAKAN
jgi:hypothetical protein